MGTPVPKGTGVCPASINSNPPEALNFGGSFYSGTTKRTAIEAPIGHKEAVIKQAWEACLMRVMADLGSLLVAEDRLCRRVDFQNPGLAEDGIHAGSNHNERVKAADESPSLSLSSIRQSPSRTSDRPVGAVQRPVFGTGAG